VAIYGADGALRDLTPREAAVLAADPRLQRLVAAIRAAAARRQ